MCLNCDEITKKKLLNTPPSVSVSHHFDDAFRFKNPDCRELFSLAGRKYIMLFLWFFKKQQADLCIFLYKPLFNGRF